MKLTTKEIALRVNKTPTRVIQLIYDQTVAAEKIGRDWLIDEDQIPVILNLPDNRGKYLRRNKQNKSEESSAKI